MNLKSNQKIESFKILAGSASYATFDYSKLFNVYNLYRLFIGFRTTKKSRHRVPFTFVISNQFLFG